MVCESARPSQRLVMQRSPLHPSRLQEDSSTNRLRVKHTDFANIKDRKHIRDGVISRVVRLASHIGQDVTFGLHFCYGNMGNKHWKEPEDLSTVVDLVSTMTPQLAHRLDWIHMPAPIDRTDAEYYGALREIRTHDGTELYIGLLHPDDVEGTKQRIASARAALGERTFGVATECGLGRSNREVLDSVCKICVQLVEPVV